MGYREDWSEEPRTLSPFVFCSFVARLSSECNLVTMVDRFCGFLSYVKLSSKASKSLLTRNDLLGPACRQIISPQAYHFQI